MNNPITLQGTLTSRLQRREEIKSNNSLKEQNSTEPYYYSFICLKGQNIDLPVIFKIKDEQGNLTEPSLKKGLFLELTGNYSTSLKNVRKSFTCIAYQLLNQKRIRKKCIGCCDNFTCYAHQNYDYCRNCELNGSRYVPRENKCSECGDGSGWIKFPGQPPRKCKLCYLARQEEEQKE
ncbi:MAG: hypothetical protein MRERV_36c003 [Mycoplasmataceae bacterium RV_VA103A]|nr:MAG: hypothetical protein MRERV_36c003 [Mycoplasmataceae bacterium RV_VA103A]